MDEQAENPDVSAHELVSLVEAEQAFAECWRHILVTTSAWDWDTAHLPEVICSIEYQALLAAIDSLL